MAPIQSVSYYDKESSLTPAYMRRVDIEFQKLGLRGVTVVVCSGDEGSAEDEKAHTTDASFPASSPHVLAVGGVKTEGTQRTAALTWDRSGGGFSALFAAPDHQKPAVAQYLTHPPAKLPSSCGYNTTGRAYPDVSSIAHHTCIVVLHHLNCLVFGTSVSAPVWAGLLALANDARASAGRPNLGWVGPALYAAAAKDGAALTKAAASDRQAGCASFPPAASGWDAFQGLGVPSWDRLGPALAAMGGVHARAPRRRRTGTSPRRRAPALRRRTTRSLRRRRRSGRSRRTRSSTPTARST